MKDKQRRQDEYFICPHCGEEVRIGASSCRECGSDAETGWSDEAHLGVADIPSAPDDDDFDYDEFIAREFPDQADFASRYSVRQWATGVLVVGIIVSFLTWLLFP